jgi:hypothetical protein
VVLSALLFTVVDKFETVVDKLSTVVLLAFKSNAAFIA